MSKLGERGGNMKNVIIVILILLLVFAFIRIVTSTYENLKREQNSQVLPIANTEFLI